MFPPEIQALMAAAAADEAIPDDQYPGFALADALRAELRAAQDARSTIAEAKAQPHGQAKRLATLQAELALIGHELVALPGGGFVVARWGQVRALADLAEVEQFLRLVKGNR
jgi:hypothetical protein